MREAWRTYGASLLQESSIGRRSGDEMADLMNNKETSQTVDCLVEEYLLAQGRRKECSWRACGRNVDEASHEGASKEGWC